ncbi:MAG: glucose-6-phosphate isomerase [Pseudomonadota bacterium]
MTASKTARADAWAAVARAHDALKGVHLRRLFEGDPGRAGRYSLEAAGLYLDYSKNRLDDAAVDALIGLAEAADLEGARRRMFAGERINGTEGRAVLHVALRDFSMRAFSVDGRDAGQDARAERERMGAFVRGVTSGRRTGRTDRPLDTVVNIGIGGSDLGPLMATEALRAYWLPGRRTHFVSNVDGRHLEDVLGAVDPERTLFIVASKTFTTQETMTNAKSARDWLRAHGASEADVAKHFVALSTNAAAVADFGIAEDATFRFWDWVGGRFSMWSAIGLSIALQVGFDKFEDMLRGAHAMDEHFRAAPLRANMPVALALAGVWNRNFEGAGAHAVLPYDQHLHRLAAYLQQADMESNGKRVAMDGEPLKAPAGPVIFGEPGTNGQHAFYQLLHQGVDLISSDFIAAAHDASGLPGHHEKLLANFLAQPEALMVGRTEAEAREDLTRDGRAEPDVDRLAPHKTFPGGRPSNAILMERLTPKTLGALVALYEHKIFCQGVLWGVNSFDQWGVELGKELAKKLLPEIAAEGGAVPPAGAHDASTNALLAWINDKRAAAAAKTEAS